MRNFMAAVLVIGGAAILGLTAAFGAGSLLSRSGFEPFTGWTGGDGGIVGGGGMMNRGGMMGGWNGASGTGQRLSLDAIAGIADRYATGYGNNLLVAEVMEFSNNFYAVLQEKDTGRGAMEILISPYSGAVSPEMGPNTMWNTKYGHMSGGFALGDNALTLAQARDLAQKALDASFPGATVHTDARTFYGYYTFDYDINGRTAGMLSVNGSTGAVWFHTWHGEFIAEKELIQ